MKFHQDHNHQTNAKRFYQGHSSAHTRFLRPLWTIPPNFFLVNCDGGLTEFFLVNYSLHAYGLELGRMLSIRTSSTSFSFEVPCLRTFRASSWGLEFHWTLFEVVNYAKLLLKLKTFTSKQKKFLHLWVLHFQELVQKLYTFSLATHDTQTYQEKNFKKNTKNKISL